MTEAAENRTRFFEIRAEREAAEVAFHAKASLMNADLKAAVEARWRAENKRKVYTWDKATRAPWFAEMRSEAVTAYDAALEQHDHDIERLDGELAILAADLEIRSTDTVVKWDFCYEGQYSSQGYGAASYAQNSLKLKGLKAALYGLEYEVREITATEPGLGRTFALYVKTDEEGIAILEEKEEPSARDVVMHCWKNGANPRVFFPMLPHGFEEANGIDFHGNDLRAEAGSTLKR